MTDEGFGVRVVERILQQYDFSDNVAVADGGVLGLNGSYHRKTEKSKANCAFERCIC